MVPVLAACLLLVACGESSNEELPELQDSAANAAGQAAAAGVESPEPSLAVQLTCGNVGEIALPDVIAVTDAAGWLGPACEADDGVWLRWTAVDAEAPPEVTDAAFVSLQVNFRTDGWQVSQPRSIADSDEVVAYARKVGSGREAVLRYSPAADDPAVLEVEFTT
jgi:hypothetical protein